MQTPPGACDCHAHVIAPEDIQPFVPNRDYTPPPASLEDYEKLHKTLGIQRAVIVQPSFYGTDNTVTLQAIHDYAGPCRGVAVVDVDIEDAALKEMHRAGVRGIRFNLAFAGGVSLDILDRLAARIAPLNWHVQLLVSPETIVENEDRFRRLPAPVVIDHFGLIDAADGVDQPAVDAMRRLLAAGKAWNKLSGCYRVSVDRPLFKNVVPVAKALIAEAPERMVWGTDWPHPAMFEYMPDDGHLLNALFDYADGEEQLRRILVDNPTELYDFDE
jgi:2-pyrone-4,6-dicarboxylate lactonase